jgi:hypothetical protein
VRVFAFNPEMKAELARLDAGDLVSVAGQLMLGTYGTGRRASPVGRIRSIEAAARLPVEERPAIPLSQWARPLRLSPYRGRFWTHRRPGLEAK